MVTAILHLCVAEKKYKYSICKLQNKCVFKLKFSRGTTSSKVLVTQVLALALHSELSCRAKAAELTFREEISPVFLKGLQNWPIPLCDVS